GSVMARLAPRGLRSALGIRAGGLLGQYRIRYRFVPAGSKSTGWDDDAMVGLRLPLVDSQIVSLRSFTLQLHGYGDSPNSRQDVLGWFGGPYRLGPVPRGRLHADRLSIVRPDGFIAASVPLRSGAADQERLRSALRA